MIDVNLHKSKLDNSSGESINFSWMASGSFFVLFLTALFFGGTILYAKYLENQSEKLGVSIREESYNFDNEQVNAVRNFQLRSEKISGNMKNKANSAQVMTWLEELIIPGVSLNQYRNDAETKKIILSCVANDFNKIASQMLNMKKSSHFNSVDIISTSREKDFINFEMEIKY